MLQSGFRGLEGADDDADDELFLATFHEFFPISLFRFWSH
jgi:hypothetical protein